MSNYNAVADHISNYLKKYLTDNRLYGYVIGISGGVDSAVVSTLCAMTERDTIVLSLPIHQNKEHLDRAEEHINWLKTKYNNVTNYTIDLTDAFESLKKSIGDSINNEVALANTRSRLRMTTLYAFANQNQMLVAGTGNKVEDYGISFFSKFGDGGVDISPIGDLTKTEVYKVADSLGIVESIKKARPSDGLYNTEKCDEDAIGATYVELEKAMEFCDMFESGEINLKHIANNISPREMEVLRIYLNRHFQNQHKMSMPPVCHVRHIIDKDF